MSVRLARSPLLWKQNVPHEQPHPLADQLFVPRIEVDPDGVSSEARGDFQRGSRAAEGIEDYSGAPVVVAAVGPAEGWSLTDDRCFRAVWASPLVNTFSDAFTLCKGTTAAIGSARGVLSVPHDPSRRFPTRPTHPLGAHHQYRLHAQLLRPGGIVRTLVGLRRDIHPVERS